MRYIPEDNNLHKIHEHEKNITSVSKLLALKHDGQKAHSTPVPRFEETDKHNHYETEYDDTD
jgi:hypothetical protein